jgi:rhodanese-related sulfurtransferase
VFLDARAPADYQAGHIANALSLPAEAFPQHWPQVAPYLATDSRIVCYCDGTECDLSHELARMLREAGYTNVHLLRNGWTEWSRAGYPTSQGPQP